MLDELKQYSILYVEDEPNIQANISEYLRSYFKNVYVASDGIEGLKLYEQHKPEVAILDIHLPRLNGLAVAKKIRLQDDAIRLIMLTGHTETNTLLKATELKLTKYMVKPFSPKTFKECLRYLSKELQPLSQESILIAPNTHWNISLERVCCNAEEINLTQKEHRLLKLFIEKKSQTVSYEEIMIAVWDDSFEREISIDSVKNQVSNLRKKLPSLCISSVYGIGYILK